MINKIDGGIIIVNPFCWSCRPVLPYRPYLPISYGPAPQSQFHGASYQPLPFTPENSHTPPHLIDYGKEPFIINLAQATRFNNNFRTTIWTGNHLQITLMSIPVGGEIGLEMHPDEDQFVRIESGQALLQIGQQQNHLTIEKPVATGDAFVLPAGSWHNIINVGNAPLKLYSIYAPPHHPAGTLHQTKADADREDNH